VIVPEEVMISIHPPHVGRDKQKMLKELGKDISIHPPRAGGGRQKATNFRLYPAVGPRILPNKRKIYV